ncbi:MAG: hypothetical protein ACM3SW_03860 [Actinomycetota bacterium]
MKLPGETSKLLALKNAAEAELNERFAEIFEAHRALAFMERRDQLFREHWTPELAASRYRFSGFEISSKQVVLHGTEVAFGFHYNISISFPSELVDQPAAIQSYFEQKYAEAAAQPQPASEPSPSSPASSPPETGAA